MITPAVEAPFVGADREALVDDLYAAFREVDRTGKPRWWSLEAPSGTGKTRVLRELYRRLAENQSDPPYWPPTVLGATRDDVATVEARRRRMTPEVVHRPAGALPDWFWWGVACDVARGPAGSSIQRDLAQFETHRPWLEESWRRAASPARRYRGTLLRTVRDVAEELAPDAAEAGLAAIGASVPGLGPLWSLSRWTLSYLTQERERRRLVDAAATLDVRDASRLVPDVVSAVSRTAVPGLPVLVAVEDLHRADPTVLAVLRGLLNADCAVLVVTTSWPQEPDPADPVTALAATVPSDRVRRLTVDGDHRGLRPLGRDDLVALLRFHYPATDDETAYRVVDRYRNPLALELVCGLPRTRRRGGDGALVLGPDDLTGLPSAVVDLYEAGWRELARPVQERLVACAWTVAALAGSNSLRDHLWEEELVSCAVQPLSAEAARVQPEDLAAWRRTPLPEHGTFHETVLQEIALRDPTSLFSASDRDVFLRALGAAAVRTRFPEELQARLVRADLVVSLHRRGLLAPTREVVESCHLLAVGLMHFDREAGRVIDLADTGLAVARDLPEPLEDTVLELRAYRALALGRLGRAAETVDEWSLIAREYEQKAAGAVTAHMLQARTELADALAFRGDADAALEVARSVARDAAAAYGHDSVEGVTAANNLGLHLQRNGRHVEAAALLRQVLRVRESRGPEDASSLSARNNLALALLSTDDALAAASFEDLVERATRTLGAEHQSTLLYRLNQALHHDRRRRNDEALALLRALVPDLTRVLGPLHGYTVQARERLGVQISRSGDHRAGVQLLRDLHRDLEASRGGDDASVLNAAVNLGFLLNTLGDHAGALALVRPVVERFERVHGTESIQTLAVVHVLGVALAGCGRVREAERCFERAAAGATAAGGPRSDDALAARISLLTVRSAPADRVLEEVRALVADIRAVGGPRTLDEVRAFAFFAARAIEASATNAAVLALRMALDSPPAAEPAVRDDLLHDLGAALSHAGRYAEALEAAGQALAGRIARRGEDDAGVLSTATVIAFCRLRTGAVATAVTEAETVVRRSEALLGPEHPTTRRARDLLEEARRASSADSAPPDA